MSTAPNLQVRPMSVSRLDICFGEYHRPVGAAVVVDVLPIHVSVVLNVAYRTLKFVM